MGLFGGLFKKLGQMVSGQKIDDEFFDRLEEQLILADMGVETAMELVEDLRRDAKKLGLDSGEAALEHLKARMSEMLAQGDHQLNLEQDGLSVILFLGVNGVGKTTTIGKLAQRFRQEGRRVLVAAADTFRAAAIDQLEVWCQRAQVELIRHSEGSDPASVVYDAIAAAHSRKAEILLVDTAGRLQNKNNLMEELKKLRRIIEREHPGQPCEVLLVLDATTGQNALSQAKLFKEAAGVTGVVLTKLDGTAKGGVVLGIQNEYRLPVKFTGWGEGVEDLKPFDPESFSRRLFEE
ncbi:MAG: signal recognition particle-docking protein FtsY [Peptococcaceae bacterium]|nr:signal recognition particle-docking protein FtsY [Peptococcaceae bacterium]